MNSELRNALEVLKRNCEGHKEDCKGCIFFIECYYGCYLMDKAPEEYRLEDLDGK